MGKTRKYENESMLINNIKEDDILSYKQLCTLLGQSQCTGKQKRNQLEYFTRYFNYEEVGDKYKKYRIIEIYDNPKDKGYICSGRSIYTKYAEILLLGHLYTNQIGNGYETYLTNKQMWKLFGLGNGIFEDYLQSENREELVKIINENQDIVQITESEVNKQYELHTDKFYQIVRSTLESLEKRSLIKYNKCTMVKVRIWENNILTNNYEIRAATSEEESNLLAAQNKALEELKLSDISQVFLLKRKDEFYKLTNKILMMQDDTKHILSYWETYHIIYCNEIIPRAVKKDIIKLNQLCMNYEVRKYINDKNLKRTNDEIETCESMNELNEIFNLEEEIPQRVPTDYLALGKAFDKVTMDLGIKDKKLLDKAKEIVEDKNMFNSIIEEVFN